MIKNIVNELTKDKKKLIIYIVLTLFILGLIPKISRFISTAKEARQAEYIAITETPVITDGENKLEISG